MLCMLPCVQGFLIPNMMNAAYQWIMMVSLVLFFLTFVDEFRYITIEHKVKVADRKTHPNPSDVVD